MLRSPSGLPTLLLAGLLLTAPVAAQTKGAAAEALFNEAQAAMEKADYPTACQRFRESDRLDPAIGTKLNLAVCEEKRGNLATAWDLLRAVIDTAEPGDDRRALAQDMASKLQPRVPKLTIRLAADAPKETSLREGSLVLEGASLGIALPMDPGKHRFVVAAPGRSERLLSVELHEGEVKDVEVEPGPPSAAPASAPVAHQAPAAPKEGGSKTLGFVLAGVGVAGVGVGAVTGILALGKKSTADSNCNDQLRRCTQAGKDADASGRSLMTVSTIGWVVGAAGLAGAGAYFLLSGAGPDKPTTALHTVIVPGGATATLAQDW